MRDEAQKNTVATATDLADELRAVRRALVRWSSARLCRRASLTIMSDGIDVALSTRERDGQRIDARRRVSWDDVLAGPRVALLAAADDAVDNGLPRFSEEEGS